MVIVVVVVIVVVAVVVTVVVAGEVVAVVVGELVTVVVIDVVAVDVIVVISQSLKVPSTNESMARFSTATTCLQSLPPLIVPPTVRSTVATIAPREYSVTILLSAVAIDVQLCADTSDGAPPMSAPQEISVRFSVQISRRSLRVRACIYAANTARPQHTSLYRHTNTLLAAVRTGHD